jgi:lipoate-protein ligase A
MARDAALLMGQAANPQALPAVRVYRWDRPAVSIGRLQAEERVRPAYPDLPLVRRPTGGRAVRHGGDLTVTVAVRGDWLPEGGGPSVLSSYHLLMEGLVAALCAAGQDVRFGRGLERGVRGSVRCFDHAADCDLAAAATGDKLVGSAQRREGPAILQQMSVSLDHAGDLEAFLRVLRRQTGEALRVEEWQSD